METFIGIIIYAGIVFVFFSCVFAIGYVVQSIRTMNMTPEEKEEFLERQKMEPIYKSRIHEEQSWTDSPNVTGDTMSMRMDQM